MPGEFRCPIYEKGLCGPVVKVTEQANNLIDWQKSQNGHLQRIDGKLDRLNLWIIGLLGSALLAVALLAVNIASKRI